MQPASESAQVESTFRSVGPELVVAVGATPWQSRWYGDCAACRRETGAVPAGHRPSPRRCRVSFQTAQPMIRPTTQSTSRSARQGSLHCGLEGCAHCQMPRCYLARLHTLVVSTPGSCGVALVGVGERLALGGHRFAQPSCGSVTVLWARVSKLHNAHVNVQNAQICVFFVQIVKLHISAHVQPSKALFSPSCFIPCGVAAAVISAEHRQAACSTSELIVPLPSVWATQTCLCGTAGTGCIGRYGRRCWIDTCVKP